MLKMLRVFFASLHSGADISMWLHRCCWLKVFTVSKLRCFIFWKRRLSPAWDQFQTPCVWIKYSHNQELVRNSFYALTEKASCIFCYVLSLFNRLRAAMELLRSRPQYFALVFFFVFFLKELSFEILKPIEWNYFQMLHFSQWSTMKHWTI